AGITAYGDAQQARLAAESGFEELVAMLRLDQHNARAWFDDPQRWRHGLVWSEAYDRENDPVAEIGSRLEYFEREGLIPAAWRFSVVAPRWDGPDETMRFGVTPESAKLNLNTASEEQLAQLLLPLLADLQIESPQPLIDCLLDWRDEDSDARPGGAEDEYY